MDKEKFIEVIRGFKDKRVAVVGDVVLDRYIYGQVERINPENPGTPLLKVEREEFRLGCAANVALNIFSLGGKVSLHCVTGDDHHGQIFERLCNNKKMDLFRAKEGETIVKERAIVSEFNQPLLRTDNGEFVLKEISEEAARQLYDSVNYSRVDAIILSDYDKRVFRGDFGEKLIELANDRNIPVIVDPKPNNVDSFKFSTLICPNIREARGILGIKSGEDRDIVKRLKEKIKSKYVIMKCGKKGMIGYDGNEFVELPTKVKDIVDVTGAGDTVCATITLSLISGLNLADSARLANYAAGIVVEKQGTSIVNPEELIVKIRQDD